MPFKSQAQRRKFYAMANRGQISRKTVNEWESATPKGKKLPEKVAAAKKLTKKDYVLPTTVMMGSGIGAGALTGWAAGKGLRALGVRPVPADIVATVPGLAAGMGGLALGSRASRKMIRRSMEKQSMAAFVDEMSKVAYGISAYSGPLGYGGFQQASHIPPFRSPRLKMAGPPAEKEKKAEGEEPSPGLAAAGLGTSILSNRLGGAAAQKVMQPSRMSQEERDMMAKMIRQARKEKITVRQSNRLPGGAYIHKVPEFAREQMERMVGKIKGPTIMYDPHVKTPAIMGHEMGHAQIQRKFLGKLLQNAPARLALMGSPLIGLGTGAIGSSMGEKEKKWGIAAPALLSLPGLMSEGGASLLALRRMKRMGASPAAMRTAYSKLLPAFGTYAARAGMGTGSAMLAAGLVPTPRAEQGQVKQAYDPSPAGDVDLPGMSKMQTPARQLQDSKQVAKVKMTKPDASKAFGFKAPSISM